MIEAAEGRKTQFVLLAAERKRKLMVRLSALDGLYRHRKLKEARHEGSGEWLPLNLQYLLWETSSNESSVLCCHGIRECILAAMLDGFLRTYANDQ